MGVIAKFMLRNIKEKRLRTFLILFSITISSALYFASGAVTGTVEKMFVEQMKKAYGSAELIIHASEKSPSQFFYTDRIGSLRDQMDYAIGTVEAGGLYRPSKDEEVRLSLKGMEFKDLQIMNPVVLNQEYENNPFTGKKIIIGMGTAEKYGLKAGGTIELEINGSKHKFLISGISEVMGLFVDIGQTINAVVPRETLSAIYSSKGAVTNVLIKLKDPEKGPFIIKELANKYKQYVVRETVSRQDIKNSSGGLTSSFMIMVITLVLMSIFIIYTSFKVITMERLPVIGTFRSIGATVWTTSLMLLLESTFYGVFGGAAGCGLGIGALYVITYATTPEWLKSQKIVLTFSISQLVGAFLLAVILSFISSLIPIVKISRIPIKDIVLNNIQRHSRRRRWKPYLGIGLIIVSVPVRFIPAKKLGMALDAMALSCMVAGTVMLIPYMTNIFIRFFEKINDYVFGNEGVLAAKNLRDNKNMVNNVSLLSIGISTLLMINTLSYSVSEEVLNVYKDWKFDIQMWTDIRDTDTERIIERIDGVESVYGIYARYNVELANSGDRLIYLLGVNSRKFLDFYSIPFEGNPNEMFRALDEGRNALSSKIFRDKYNLKAGDTVSLMLNNRVKGYKIIGFFDTLMMNGSYIMISDRYFKLDTGDTYFNQYEIKTKKDPKAVVDSIKKKFKGKPLWVQTAEESEEVNQKSNEQIFSILKGFSIMTMIVGIFGVLNNFLISFMERRRSLAMFRSIGMSRRQIIKMIFIESLTGGLIGGTAGMALGFIELLFVSDSHVLKEIAAPIPMHYSPDMFIYSMISGMVITLIASVAPALKSSRLNIIESVKYE